MILTCPACASQFVVDPAALGAAGRTVRCGKCKHEWHAVPPLLSLPAEGLAGAGVASGRDDFAARLARVTAIPPGAQMLPAEAQLSVRQRVARRNAVIVAVPLALLLALPLLLLRGCPAAPAKHAGTAAVEAPAPSKPVLLENAETKLVQEEGRTILILRGVLHNVSDHVQPLPSLRAEALNGARKVVKAWDFSPAGELAEGAAPPTLEAGQTYAFEHKEPFAEQGVVDIAFHFN